MLFPGSTPKRFKYFFLIFTPKKKLPIDKATHAMHVTLSKGYLLGDKKRILHKTRAKVLNKKDNTIKDILSV